ncbi:MAG TPA: RluA family pseudouridine synthase [Opitutaceae bacterium]|nr:RluA family pseudouridine synthase [Opitutaceae bacterium]
MATWKQSWRIGAAQQGVRLDHFLAEALPKALGREVSRAQVRRLIVSGLVSRNGRREQIASYELREGTRVEVFLDPAKFDAGGASGMRQATVKDFTWTPERILFEDEWLIVVDKPAGLPTQPTLDAARASVFGTLKSFLAQRDGGEPYLALQHRLDRDTSGVLLFTRDQRANAGATAMFAEKLAQKTYLALATGGSSGAERWSVEDHLGVVGRVGKASKFGAVRSGGDPAQTSFRLLERLHGGWLVEAQPHTGRTHQIRVHLAEGGHPIFGDGLYGGPMQLRTTRGEWRPALRVLLHAARLEFPHPVTGTAIEVQSAVPPDFAESVNLLR